MCSPPPLCTLCWSATRPRLSIMRRFCLICSWQCISCYPERRICCMSSGWTRKLWRRPWRGSDILWSKTSSPPTSGGGRSPSKSAFWSAIYRRKNLRKFIFLYKQQILFYFLCRIWFWLHYVAWITGECQISRLKLKMDQDVLPNNNLIRMIDPQIVFFTAGHVTIFWLRHNDNATTYNRSSETRKNSKNIYISVSTVPGLATINIVILQ